MDNSLFEIRLQRIMVLVFFILDKVFFSEYIFLGTEDVTSNEKIQPLLEYRHRPVEVGAWSPAISPDPVTIKLPYGQTSR